MSNQSSGELQRAHYNRILDEYDRHYGDVSSREYRRRFFIVPLLTGLDLNGCRVADLAAGSGPTTLELKGRFPRAEVVGFDVSDEAVRQYRARTGCDAHVWDLTHRNESVGCFDAVVVVGGLHHCICALDDVLRNIASVLRPGGLLLMAEPSRDSWLEPLRRTWYRRDHYFEAATEGALSHDELLARGKDWFTGEWARYMGGPAYFLVYNSLVFRVPLPVKALAARPLMALESVTNLIPWKGAFPYFIARWRRRSQRST